MTKLTSNTELNKTYHKNLYQSLHHIITTEIFNEYTHVFLISATKIKLIIILTFSIIIYLDLFKTFFFICNDNKTKLDFILGYLLFILGYGIFVQTLFRNVRDTGYLGSFIMGCGIVGTRPLLNKPQY